MVEDRVCKEVPAPPKKPLDIQTLYVKNASG